MTRSLVPALALVLAALPSMASARPRVALPKFSGDPKGQVHDAVSDALDPAFSLISRREIDRSEDKLGLGDKLSTHDLEKLARELDADAVVEGDVSKRHGHHLLHVRLLVHGKVVRGFSVEFASLHSKKFKSALRDKMVSKIGTDDDRDARGDRGDHGDRDDHGDHDDHGDSHRDDGDHRDDRDARRDDDHGDHGDRDDSHRDDGDHRDDRDARRDDDHGDRRDDADHGDRDHRDDADHRDDGDHRDDRDARRDGDHADHGDADRHDDRHDDGDRRDDRDHRDDRDRDDRHGDGERRTAERGDDDGPDGISARVSPERRQPLHAANRDAIRVDLGGSVTSRSLTFVSRSFNTGLGPPPPYRNSPVGGGRVDGEIYPFAFGNPHSAGAGIGLAGSYDQTASLAVTNSEQPGMRFPVTQRRWSLGARYRIPFGGKDTSPTLTIGVDYGHRTFKINHAGLNKGLIIDVPDVDYKGFTPSLTFRIPFNRTVALVAGGGSMLLLGVGGIGYPNEYGRARVTEGEGMAGLDFVFANRYALRIVAEAALIGYKFEYSGAMTNNRDGDPASPDVGGAADRYIGGAATFGIVY